MSISIKNVSKFYGKQAALNNVSFEVNVGEIVGFIGPNGAGKSTMMKIITGIIPPESGQVLINGQNISDSPVEIRQIIGFLPENNPLYLNMYVKEYLSHVAGFYKIAVKQRVEEIIQRTGLGNEQHKLIGALSKGYRQRVGLAQALIHDPQVLILDEPTSGLDPNQLIEIRELIKETGKNKTIMLSTHIMQEVEAICQRIIVINKGNIVADGNAHDVKNMSIEKITIIVEFNKDVTDAQLNELSQFGKIIKVDNRNWLIETSLDDDPRELIFSFAVKHDLKVLSMQKKSAQLEEVFKQLTK